VRQQDAGGVGPSLEGLSEQYALGHTATHINVTVEAQGYDGDIWNAIGGPIEFELQVDNASTPKMFDVQQEMMVDLYDHRAGSCSGDANNINSGLRLQVAAYDDHGKAEYRKGAALSGAAPNPCARGAAKPTCMRSLFTLFTILCNDVS
jgi:hypothetical protein